VKTIPQSDLTCLNGTVPTQEAQQVEAALHLNTLTPTQVVEKIVAYAALHLATLVADCKQMNTAFDASQFTTVGTEACLIAQAIFGDSYERFLV